MKHVKVKPNNHVLIFEVKSDIPIEMAQDIADRLTKSFPEFRMMITQSDLTLLTIEDEPEVKQVW
jgi:hypothetical protein